MLRALFLTHYSLMQINNYGGHIGAACAGQWIVSFHLFLDLVFLWGGLFILCGGEGVRGDQMQALCMLGKYLNT
jgi:hypothetical protein